MREWVRSQLVTDRPGPIVIIDRHRVATAREIDSAAGGANSYHVHDWFELRRVWELHGRRWELDNKRPVLVTHDPAITASTDLPYDIERASTVRVVRALGPVEIRSALCSLEDRASDRAAEQLIQGVLSPVDVILNAAADLPAVPVIGKPEREFHTALILSGRPLPEPVLELARGAISDPLGVAVLDSPQRIDSLRAAWQEWIAAPTDSPWANHMSEGRAELVDLFLAGRLEPVYANNADIPSWARVGVVSESPVHLAHTLLDAAPSGANTLEDWVRVAQWWGELRSALAQINPVDQEIETKAWLWWGENDNRFLEWLRSSYGAQLTRAWTSWPASLDKVQPFLARRHQVAPRLMLVVLDGMSFTQWTYIRELASIQVRRVGGTLAMLPTLTEVSRQAIAAGTLPTEFVDSIQTTSREPQLWARAWAEIGVTAPWLRVDGARVDELSVVPFGDADVIGLVLSATDELLHSAELLGDLGLHASLAAWVQAGVLTTLLARAAEHGYEVWLTADHGNLFVETAKGPREGAFVERAGTRARRYASKTLRDAAAVQGVAWNVLPGYPRDESEKLLFAPGRVGWGPSRLSHGGLSLDEVIVPLVQIERQS